MHGRVNVEVSGFLLLLTALRPELHIHNEMWQDGNHHNTWY